MARRVPISLYLNILAGIIVLFNHYVAFETGDVALNKITGAAGRLYSLFRDTFQGGRASHLVMMLCGPTLSHLVPQEVVAYVQAHYCHATGQDSDCGTSSYRQPHEGYGGSSFAFAHHRSTRRFVPQTSAEGLLRTPFRADWPSQHRLMQAIWHRSGEALTTLGTLLLHACATWWWFRAPVEMTGIVLGTFSVLLMVGYVFGSSVVIRFVSQVYLVFVADLLRCIEWEAQRWALDVGIVMMEQAYGLGLSLIQVVDLFQYTSNVKRHPKFEDRGPITAFSLSSQVVTPDPQRVLVVVKNLTQGWMSY